MNSERPTLPLSTMSLVRGMKMVLGHESNVKMCQMVITEHCDEMEMPVNEEAQLNKNLGR